VIVGTSLPSGVHFARLQSRLMTQTQKLLLLRQSLKREVFTRPRLQPPPVSPERGTSGSPPASIVCEAPQNMFLTRGFVDNLPENQQDSSSKQTSCTLLTRWRKWQFSSRKT
jgi:hypothetical protein